MGKNKTSVKICGITSIEQALKVCELGADAIGIISVKESQRYVDLEEKQKIFKVLKDLYPRVERVSVLKNHPLELLIDNLKKKANETIIQLHGDENIDYCQKLKQKIPNICLWKAFRIKDKKDLEKIKYYESFLDAILLDSWNKDTYGGSGKKIEQKYYFQALAKYMETPKIIHNLKVVKELLIL